MTAASAPVRLQRGLFEIVRDTGVTKQERLLHRCIDRGLDLCAQLTAEGLAYDDLRYTFDLQSGEDGRECPVLQDYRLPENGIGVVSFFAGCGGLDLGFEAAGFRHDASVEINPIFCSTIRKNRPIWNVLGPPSFSGDVSAEDEVAENLQRAAHIERPYEGIFIGGPPCQPFSIAANQRFSKSGINFKRIGYRHKTQGTLLHHYTSLIKKFRPTAFLIENVPGLIEIDKGEQLRDVLNSLRRAGYTVEDPLQLNAAEYSVPQQRARLFIIGSRTGKRLIPPKRSRQLYGCGQALAGIPESCANHETREHKAESILRYMRLDFGERDHLGRVDRLDPEIPSKTVIAGGTKGGGRSHLHPHVPRTLTVRECARLQTFPDDFVFEGPIARQFTQVGNAVPPVLAAQLAAAMLHSFFR